MSSSTTSNPDELNQRWPNLTTNGLAAGREKKKRVSQSHWALEQGRSETGVPEKVRWQLLRQHGTFSMAYSAAFQPRLRHFGDERGWIAYRRRFGQTMALGDPVAPRSNYPQLLSRFIGEMRRPTFVEVSRTTAEQLVEEGYHVTPMGVDTTLDLAEFDFRGKSKEWLRYAGNWTRRRGYTVRELTFAELGMPSVEALSEAWRKTRTVKRKEVRFLNRPIVLEDEPDVRKFYLLDAQQKLHALVYLDPLYCDGRIVGYVTAFKRRHPSAPQYAEQALMKAIIEQLQNEGIGLLKLGLSPLVSVDQDELPGNPLTAAGFRFCFRSSMVNRFVYHLQGHARYKRRFRGREETMYFASPGRVDGLRLAALIGLCGIA